MKEKICLVGGEDVHKRISLSLQLIKSGFEVPMIGTSSHEFPEPIKYYNYNLVRSLSPISDYKTMKWLQDFFDKNAFSIIHTFDTKPAFLVPLAIKNTATPITRTITGLGTIFMSKTYTNKVLRGVYKMLHHKAKSRVFKTVFQNLDDKKLYLSNNLVSEDSSDLIYSSGIDLKEFKEQAKRNNRIFTFICVARLVYEKGIINLLEAARICSEKGYEFRFLLVGPLEENSNNLNQDILDSYKDVVDISTTQFTYHLTVNSIPIIILPV